MFNLFVTDVDVVSFLKKNLIAFTLEATKSYRKCKNPFLRLIDTFTQNNNNNYAVRALNFSFLLSYIFQTFKKQ